MNTPICERCGQYDYEDHVCIVLRPFECQLCGAYFPTEYHICNDEDDYGYVNEYNDVHVEESDEDDIDLEECQICGQYFNPEQINIHYRFVHNDHRFKCNYCDRTFKYNSDRVIHMRRHTSERPFRCDICDKTYTSLSDLNQHKRGHTDYYVQCPLCDKRYKFQKSLTYHIKTKHS